MFDVYFNIWTNFFAPALLPTDEYKIDSDVKLEKAIISNMTKDQMKQYSLVVKDMSKFYGKYLAVNQLSVSVKS